MVSESTSMRFVLWSFLVAMWLPAVASAQQPEAAARDEEARTLFQAATLAMQDGRYEEALAHFRRAYELSQRPALLYNIGVTAERLLHFQEALEAYQAFLESGSEVRSRAEVERRIELMHEAIAREQAAHPEEEPSPPEPSPTPTPTPATPAQPVPAASSGGGVQLVWTWVAGGLALATGGVAIGTWVAANNAYGDLSNQCGARGCTNQEIAGSNVETLVLVTNVFLVGSLVLTAATGGVLAIELVTSGGGDGGSAEQPSAELVIGVGNVGVRGRF